MTTALGIIWGLYRKGVIPVFRKSRKAIARIELATDGLLGRPAIPATDTEPAKPAIPSLFDRMAALEKEVAEIKTLAEENTRATKAHIEWHPAPAGRPASGRRTRPNGVQK